VHHAACASLARAVDYVLHALHVDRAVRTVGLSRLPIRGSDVVDHFHVAAGSRHGRGLGQVTFDDLDARLAQGRHLGPLQALGPHQPPHGHAAMTEVARQVPPGEAGDARDKRGHRGSCPAEGAAPVTGTAPAPRIDASSIA
jgi:hypothetical protein